MFSKSTNLYVLVLLATALSGCGGVSESSSGSGTTPPAAAAACPAGSGDVWYDCQLTPASVASPLVEEGTWRAEFAFNVGDEVVNCYDGSTAFVATINYPNDGTVQIDSGQWVNYQDLAHDGAIGACK